MGYPRRRVDSVPPCLGNTQSRCGDLGITQWRGGNLDSTQWGSGIWVLHNEAGLYLGQAHLLAGGGT